MRDSSMLKTLQKHTQKYQQAYQKLNDQLAEKTQQVLEVEHELAQNLNGIAALHLDAFSQTGIVANVLAQRKQQWGILRQQLEKADAEIQKKMEAQKEIYDELETLNLKWQEDLSSNEEYLKIKSDFELLAEQLKQTEQKYTEIADECHNKLEDYQDNPYYAYLSHRAYGTEKYAAWRLFRFMDNWIASLCNFHENNRNEQILLAMRSENQRIFNDISTRTQALKVKMESIEKTAQKKAGYSDLLTALSQQESLLGADRANFRSIEEMLEKYAEKKDSYFAEATSLLAKQLNSIPTEALIERVKATPELDDDILAEKVIKLQSTLQNLNNEIASLKSKMRETFDNYQRAQSLEQETEKMMREKKNNRPNYSHGPTNFDLDNLVDSFVREVISRTNILDAIQNHRHSRDTTYTHTTTTTTTTISSSSSGGFGGGDFSSSGGFGGGSHHTSDRF